MTVLQSIVGVASKLLMLVAGAALVLMMLQIVADAAMRTLFNSSLSGTNEFVSYYYMVAVTFLPLAYLQRHRGHVIIELFTSRLHRRALAWLDGSVFLLGALAMGYFCYAALWRALAMTAINEYVIGMILVVTWPARWLLVLGTGLMSLCMAIQAVEEFLIASGRHAPGDANDHSPH